MFLTSKLLKFRYDFVDFLEDGGLELVMLTTALIFFGFCIRGAFKGFSMCCRLMVDSLEPIEYRLISCPDYFWPLAVNTREVLTPNSLPSLPLL